MTTLDVVTAENRKAGSVELSAAIFQAPVKPDLFHAEVFRQLAKRRAGTHSSRNRSAVSGGGSKPWRQKGTGRSRQGTTRAPQWAGGGVVFGPVPRSYEHSLPKKMRRAALRGALSLRREEGAITLLEEIELPEIKTRRVAEMLRALSLEGAGVLIVIDAANEKLERSARNLRNVSVLRVAGLNVYDVLRHPKLVITRAALGAIEERLCEDRRRGGADSREDAS
jgi:large subunit ribosomal protein L4